jgi:hypothetical protein
MTSHEVARQAADFWSLVGCVEAFPRSLEDAVLWGLPLGVIKLPRLGLLGIRSYLGRWGIDVYPGMADRHLRGCLVACAGEGFIFLDGADPEDERRFSLAHEIAHFLRDHLFPRQRAISLLGEEIVEVLDGRRPANARERVAGVLRGVRLGTFTHLLERGRDGWIENSAVLAAEDMADRVALEILAPRAEVVRRFDAENIKWRTAEALGIVATLLVRDFGLPTIVAERYARLIIASRRPARSFREWLGE